MPLAAMCLAGITCDFTKVTEKPVLGYLRYLGFALLPPLSFLLVALTVVRINYLPNVPTISFLWLSGDIAYGVRLGFCVHLLLFCAFNFYLLRRTRSRKVLSSLRVWLPSICMAALLGGLSLLWVVLGLRYGLEYEGASYVKLQLILHLWALGIAAFWVAQKLRSTRNTEPLTSISPVLGFNCYLHVIFIAILFPYLGEVP